MKFLESIFYYR